MKRSHWKQVVFLTLLLSVLLSISPLTGYADQSPTADPAVDLPMTGFEDSGGEEWTTYDEELAFLEEVAEKSERVSYSQVGTSAEGRPLHLVRVGFPEPPSDEDIAAGRNMLIMGTQHGNEPSGREMSLKLLRDLAFTEDPELLELLGESTILFIPTVNPDGREADNRESSEGVDLNRDQFKLKTPEARTIAKIQQQFQPDITLDAHEQVSGPNVALLWPTNLNVDEEVRALSQELVQDYMIPDVEEAGLTTGLYPGSGTGWTLRNSTGLRHGLSVLVEATWDDEPAVRVEGQMRSAESVLRFYHERFDDIGTVVKEAPQRKAAEGEEQSEPFYLDGAVDEEPEESAVLNPPPCGYLLRTSQIDDISQQIELFSLETEQVSENGVFVTMAQPMMTVVPLLLDQGAKQNVVDGKALYDCADPGSVEPPAPPEPAQYETDFAANEVGNPPAAWSTLWRDSGWTVLDEPSRLEHVVTDGGGRRVLTWDEVGDVRGDVEVSGLVRTHGTGTTMFQIHLNASGEEGSENSYYLDMRSTDQVRINRNLDSRFQVLETADLPFTAEENTWYHVVFQREGDTLSGKVWPYGEEEPDAWQVTVEDRFIDNGKVGVGHVSSGMVNEWAFFGVGTVGDPAPRAPEDLLPDVDKTLLQSRVDEINAENLNEADYTEESWQFLQNALAAAGNVIENPEATQPDVDTALAALNQAYDGLMTAPEKYDTDFAGDEIGEPPVAWSTLWRDSGWAVLDEPSRLEHVVTPGGGRRALTWDEVGDVRGDVEVSGLVRGSGSGSTMFQIHLNASGDAGSENSYYLDMRTSDQVRINRNQNSNFDVLETADLPFTAEENTWYHVVFQHEGDKLRGKVWPYGEDEPADWQVEVVDDSLDHGLVGVGHVTSSRINEWAFFGVGTGGVPAPRAPEDLFEPEDPGANKTELQNKVDEINSENLNEADYTDDSWRALQDALAAAEDVLKDPEATQADVDAALAALNEAYDGLEEADEMPISAKSMITSVERFAEAGAFENDRTVRSLTMHLTAVIHYEEQDEAEKVVKHMESFKQLLGYQHENALISTEAFNSLQDDADALIEKWQ